ncbi:MAG: DNA polymerase III subunit gamma/tau [Candidatus Pacebacteria bacterium]|nr:DNA polymerase III subunit gamma/tau [Candidatus Paceibacterota bacterium]
MTSTNHASNGGATHSSTGQTSSPAKPHLSLYRKYRPHTFADVVGQSHIVDVLKQSVEKGTVGHAYLFCGSRGTGKTSIARIFARALGTTINDLYEIDAASNTSVDDIRELSEAVHTVPLESKYKVYILDEVHMLSKAAFNAFLKTLEEPPKHVIFILATTETEKLPDTIVSRCEVYNFKKPTAEMLKSHVLDIAQKEGAEIETSAAELVALLGDGSFRDTLSTLQKVLSYTGTDSNATHGSTDGASGTKKSATITLEQVEQITGAPKAVVVSDFVKGLVLKDASLALTALGTAGRENLDMKVFAKLAMTRLRYMLMRTIAEKEASVLASDLSAGDVVMFNDLAKQVTGQQIAGVLKRMLEVYHSIGKTYVQSLPLELVVGEVVGSAVGK